MLVSVTAGSAIKSGSSPALTLTLCCRLQLPGVKVSLLSDGDSTDTSPDSPPTITVTSSVGREVSTTV